MLLKISLALLSTGLLFTYQSASALAEIIGGQNVNSERRSQTENQTVNSRQIEPTLGTVPGLYYDPSNELSPSLQQMEGASQAGTISYPNSIPTDYNMQRAWSTGATPDRIIKVGDLKSNPTLNKMLDIERLTLRDIAANGGASIETIPLKSVGLISNMTVGEFFEMFPELENASVKDVPILAETVNAVYSAGQNPQGLERTALNVGEQQVLNQLAGVDPRLTQVPLGEIANGNWDSALALAQNVAIQELVKKYPELENVPIAQVLDGNWEGAALNLGEQQVLNQLAGVDPRLTQVPLGEIANGNWDSALALVQNVAIQELVKKYPELENVPIAQVLNGDIKGAALNIAQKELVGQLAQNPAFENIPVSQLATGDWKGALSVVAQQQLQGLLKENPQLANLPADKLFPIVNGVVSGDWDSVARQAGNFALKKGLNLASKELLKAYPELAKTPLGALPIENLTVGDIMGLADKPLGTMPKIANKYLSELGNLSQTPGTMLAVDSAMILLTGDVFGRLDISYAGPTETPITRVLSGGTRNQLFLPEPCTEESCKHFEISDVLSGFGGLGNVQGKAWVEGKAQSVPGGKGFLQWVNGGKERTGVPVWSTDAHVKLSLENIDEGGNGKPATAQVWLNFQVCVYPPFMGEHCTPHFISMPTPWKVQEGGLMLVFSRASVPDFVSDARDRVASNYQSQYEGMQCDPSAPIASNTLSANRVMPPSSGGNGSAQNLQRYLARIAAGESGGGRDLGPNPDTGAYGEYQFTPSSRQLLMSRYPDLDPWSRDKTVRDKAALAWIDLYGKEKGVKVLSAIFRGDFSTADRILGSSQFTSLPGGAEEHAMWRNPSNLATYGASGNGSSVLVANQTPCTNGPSNNGSFVQGTGKASGELIRPSSGSVTSEFGPRTSPCDGCSSYHKGIDLGVGMGQPVRAADGGTVIYAGAADGYGYVVIVDHGNGRSTRYGHVSSFKVKTGDKVTQGQTIAASGEAGVGTGPHLHFEVREETDNSNPFSGEAHNPREYVNF
jgi:murein DD-endopeptidase MepM/ murein hydrolase activator NlpD/uncharacterized protein (DUF433 family)